jgi:hypothetical protein
VHKLGGGGEQITCLLSPGRLESRDIHALNEEGSSSAADARRPDVRGILTESAPPPGECQYTSIKRSDLGFLCLPHKITQLSCTPACTVSRGRAASAKVPLILARERKDREASCLACAEGGIGSAVQVPRCRLGRWSSWPLICIPTIWRGRRRCEARPSLERRAGRLHCILTSLATRGTWAHQITFQPQIMECPQGKKDMVLRSPDSILHVCRLPKSSWMSFSI